MKKIQNISKIPFPVFGTLFVMVFLLCSITNSYSQTIPAWGDGEIEDVEIEIVQERQIALPPANRHYEKIPPRPSEPIKPPIQYDFQSFNFRAPQIDASIRPLKIKAQSPAKVYGGFLRLGY